MKTPVESHGNIVGRHEYTVYFTVKLPLPNVFLSYKKSTAASYLMP